MFEQHAHRWIHGLEWNWRRCRYPSVWETYRSLSTFILIWFLKKPRSWKRLPRRTMTRHILWRNVYELKLTTETGENCAAILQNRVANSRFQKCCIQNEEWSTTGVYHVTDFWTRRLCNPRDEIEQSSSRLSPTREVLMTLPESPLVLSLAVRRDNAWD